MLFNLNKYVQFILNIFLVHTDSVHIKVKLCYFFAQNM